MIRCGLLNVLIPTYYCLERIFREKITSVVMSTFSRNGGSKKNIRSNNAAMVERRVKRTLYFKKRIGDLERPVKAYPHLAFSSCIYGMRSDS